MRAVVTMANCSCHCMELPVTSEPHSIKVCMKSKGAGCISVQLDGLCILSIWQSGKMNIEMRFQHGRKLYHSYIYIYIYMLGIKMDVVAQPPHCCCEMETDILLGPPWLQRKVSL